MLVNLFYFFTFGARTWPGAQGLALYLYYLPTSCLAQREMALAEFRKQLIGLRPAWVVLDTCDRFELYCTKPCPLPLDWPHKEGPQALRHLYRVVSGLESPLFGEKAIQGQVKEAYNAACSLHKLAKDLHQSFQSALRVGKRVRHETKLDSGAMSHVRATWEILQKNLTRHQLEQLAICFIGANQLNEDLAELLRGKGLSKFFLGNRSFAKAEEACRNWGGQAFHLHHIIRVVQRCQVVISATRAPHFVLRPEHLCQRETPLYIFDLAVPRDVDPLVAQMPNVYLWNVEDIENQIAVNSQERRAKGLWAERIIDEELEKFYA